MKAKWTDDTIYDALCERDEEFADDQDWFNQDDACDIKDKLRIDVEVDLYLGWEEE